MEQAKTVLYVVLGVVGAWFLFVWGRDLVTARGLSTSPASPAATARSPVPTPWQLFVGFVTNFFDYFGIGSFATTTSLFRSRGTVDDRVIPGTLNVGHTAPTLAEAFISITIFQVDATTLVAMTAAAVAGSWLGGGVVARWPRRKVRIGMGSALLVVGTIIAYRQFGDPTGGTALGVSGAKLVVGCGVNFVLGALMTLGIGLFAPCLLLVSLLGMDPTAAYPIMMSSCALLMPFASWSFVRAHSYDRRAAVGLAIAGVPGVFLGAWALEKLKHVRDVHHDVHVLNWVILVVVLYTAISMLLAARASARAKADGGTELAG